MPGKTKIARASSTIQGDTLSLNARWEYASGEDRRGMWLGFGRRVQAGRSGFEREPAYAA